MSKWIKPKIWWGVSMHEKELYPIRSFFKELFFWIKIKFKRDKSFEIWKKRVKRVDQLSPEERKIWYEEQDQMWKDYHDSLL